MKFTGFKVVPCLRANYPDTGIIITVNRDGTMDVQGPFRPLLNEKISDWQLARGEA
jgi:hypothetical protein